MAARTWGGGSGPQTSNWSDATNWTGDTKPGAGDDITFDGTDTTNCTLDENTAALGNLTFAAAYTGTFDAATYDIDCDDFTVAGTAFDAGSGSHTVSGDFDNTGVTTWTEGTADWTFDGSSKDINMKYISTLSAAEVTGTCVIHSGTPAVWHYVNIPTLTVAGSGELDIADFATNGLRVETELQVTGTAVITGIGNLMLRTADITVMTGTIDCATLTFLGTCSIVAATYDSASIVNRGYGAGAFTMGAGTTVFEGDVTHTSITGGVIANNTNNPNVIYNGNLTIGSLTYTGGSGTHEIKGDLDASAATSWDDGTETWEFVGDADQDVSGPSTSLGEVLIDNAVDTTVYLTSDLTCENITHNGSGSFNANNYDVNTNDVTGAGRIIPNGGVWYLDGWWTGTNTEVTSG